MRVLSLLSFAQEETNRLVTLTKQIIEAKSSQELYPLFDELKDIYFSRTAIESEGGIPPEAGKDNRYPDFVEFLRSLGREKKELAPFIDYYIALTRYHQLKYLQEKQLWDEYFSQGNIYRDELQKNLKKLVFIAPKDTLNIYAQLLLWQFYRDEQNALSDSAILDLMQSISEYAKTASNIRPIEEVAERFLAYGETGKAKELYKVYVEKLVTSDIKDDELKDMAQRFYSEDNLEVAEVLYDIYIERISKSIPKEKLLPILIHITKLFTPLESPTYDALYAEKIFNKIYALGGKVAFDDELLHLRAFNLEKAKEYIKAKDSYIDLVKYYPSSTYADEADFKAGLIYTYIARDVKTGRIYFEKLSQKDIVTPQVISGLYQLGLLSQWEGDSPQAKEYYDNLLKKANNNSFEETVNLTKERLREIEESRPIEYNLKTFLDVSLKEDYAGLELTKLDLRYQPDKVKRGEIVNIGSHPYTIESGCFPVEIVFLWSGHLGKTEPLSQDAAFDTNYLHSGSKEINLVVVSPSGIIDRDIIMIDVD